MARPLRFEYPGAFYHIMNRGTNHAPIFLRPKEDRLLFLHTIAETVKKYQIKIHAYSLMNNHYHLLLETPIGNLSQAMRHIDGVYTQKFNFIHRRDGPLLRGRFKSKLVQEGTYFLEVTRYIHNNGVKANQYSSPDKDPNCSHSYYLGTKKAPPWLTTGRALSFFKNSDRPERAYHEFVLAGVPNNLRKVLNHKKWPAILGDDNFIQSIRNKFINETNADSDQPQKRELTRWKHPNKEAIIAWICQSKNCSKNIIYQRTNGKTKEIRTVTALLLHRLAFMPYREIGQTLGGLTYGAVGYLIKNGENQYGKEALRLEKEFMSKKEFMAKLET